MAYHANKINDFCIFRESNRKVEELSTKLLTTKKQLHKAMSFAEDIVREQEVLLIQLHTKQKENNFMANQFGSLKMQLKVKTFSTNKLD